MRITIEVPSISTFLDLRQIKSLVKDPMKELFHERVVPLAVRGTCRVLELVANNSADAHDYLIGKLRSRESER